MSTELIINATLPETRIALLEDGHIQELMIDHAGHTGSNTIVGNIYKGRVTRVLPGMQAAFVDIGLDKAAFLYVDDIYVHPEVFNRDLLGEEAQEEAAEDSREGAAQAAGEESETSEASTSASSNESGESDTESAEGDAEGDSEEDLESSDDSFEDSEESEDPGSSEDSEESEEMADDPKDSVKGDTVAKTSGRGDRGRGDRSRGGRGRFRRGRGGRGGGGRDGGRDRGPRQSKEEAQQFPANEQFPESVIEAVGEKGNLESDRAGLEGESNANAQTRETIDAGGNVRRRKPEFKEERDKQRRVGSRRSMKPERAQVSIDQLLKEGQEILVQVAKDPIASKGARLTCHISLAGRHLVCMPTIDHVGVSRRIERDDDRRRLRDFVEKNRPGHMGFIVRTATSKKDPESWIKADMDYLELLWTNICEKAGESSAPSLIYQDLNPILRAVRDWIGEDVKRVLIDDREAFNDLKSFVDRYMPSLSGKIELYQGDIPVFDAYNISNEINRALERKVWLKSGGYLVIDQAEALVAIDVNTGRYVGKKNLEDTILKTNLEAVEEIAYQLRLRNCGGIIILDLIDMEKEENRHRVLRALEAALEKDRARPTILRMSELGLIEMTRKRTRDTLVRTLCQTCNQCEGKGFVKNHSTVANEILREVERAGIERDMQRILIQASPEVIEILALGHQKSLDALERRFKKQIFLQEVTDFHQEQFEVSGDILEHRPRRDIEIDHRRDRERGRHQRRGGRNDRTERGDRNDRGDRGDRDRNREERGASSGSSGGDDRPKGKIIIRPVSEVQPTVTPVQATESSAPVDEDSIGNSGDNLGGNSSENPGNSGPSVFAADGNSEGNSAPQVRPRGDEDDTDEDRLAYLRAQAAQDAAIAGVPTQSRRNSGGGNGNGQVGSGGGGRGGRHRRGGRGRDRYRHA